ncbi:hypothetical protein QEH54_18020 [Pelagicoccus sp. SDUM812003]|nr:hypothetical protein [Pelagicoccus sp. SDUM812003]
MINGCSCDTAKSKDRLSLRLKPKQFRKKKPYFPWSEVAPSSLLARFFRPGSDDAKRLTNELRDSPQQNSIFLHFVILHLLIMVIVTVVAAMRRLSTPTASPTARHSATLPSRIDSPCIIQKVNIAKHHSRHRHAHKTQTFGIDR